MYLICALISIFSTCTSAATTIYYDNDGDLSYTWIDITGEQRMEWISVDDRMPEQGKCCLLYQTYPPGTMFNCRADPLNRNFFSVGGLNWKGKFISYEDQYAQDGLKYISHWMPLPPPPK